MPKYLILRHLNEERGRVSVAVVATGKYGRWDRTDLHTEREEAALEEDAVFRQTLLCTSIEEGGRKKVDIGHWRQKMSRKPPLNEAEGNPHTLYSSVLHCFEPPMAVTNLC